jgi:hypothetical protein
MSFEATGLKEGQQKLEELSNYAEKLNGQAVSFSEIFTDTFLSENTAFANFDELIEASGFKVESQKDFEAIPDQEWDEFILTNTNFENWQEMLDVAGLVYAQKKFSF